MAVPGERKSVKRCSMWAYIQLRIDAKCCHVLVIIGARCGGKKSNSQCLNSQPGTSRSLDNDLSTLC